MRIAFVVPRYGPDIIGGAETAARLLAEHLVSLRHWQVDVLTTCASDFVTWDDVYPAGEEWINGVRVVRHRSAAGREPSFHPLSAALLADPGTATAEEANQWLELQGPVTPALGDAVAAWDGDAVVFYPYLYYPTVRIIERVPVPAILHPAAHDEPALRLPIYPRVFGAADALVFQTTAERELVQRLFPVASHHQLLLGLGVDDPDDGPVRAVRVDGAVPPPPYLLCLGRVDGHKGTDLLARYFARYKERRPGPLRLVFAGPVVDRPPIHPDIDLLGPVSDATKWSLLAGASALVSPSPWEAFSLVVAESWSARTPVLVNAGCAATVEHCRRSGGGLTFAGFGEFEVEVDRLVDEPGFGPELGRRGRNYVDARFRWPQIIDRYARFIESVAARGRLRAPETVPADGDGSPNPDPSGLGPATASIATPSRDEPGSTRHTR